MPELMLESICNSLDFYLPLCDIEPKKITWLDGLNIVVSWIVALKDVHVLSPEPVDILTDSKRNFLVVV